MTSRQEKAKRRRPWQFGVSTLLLLTTLVAIAFGWWLDRQRLMVELQTVKAVAKQQEALNDMELARVQREVFEIQVELRIKTAEADVYRQTIVELSTKLKAE